MGFSKYANRGAYHWDHISILPWKYHCFTAARYALVLEAARITPGEFVLDVGCGDGALSYLMYKKGGVITGIDPDPVGRDLAIEMFRLKNAEAEFLDSLYKVADMSQDVAICAEVIEHVSDPVSLMRGIRRSLVPGGRMILSTPVKLTEHPLDSQHIREYFPNELEREVEKHFDIIEHRLALPAFSVEMYYWRPFFFFHLPLIKLLMNILSAWFGIQVMRGVNSLNRYPTTQIVEAKRK